MLGARCRRAEIRAATGARGAGLRDNAVRVSLTPPRSQRQAVIRLCCHARKLFGARRHNADKSFAPELVCVSKRARAASRAYPARRHIDMM
ncbi:hypothetical protein FGB62_66g147 [Gracilaria domingensis]|nr:hypothetical protein FGB62_66g147 [Gracilaria domingensis]